MIITLSSFLTIVVLFLIYIFYYNNDYQGESKNKVDLLLFCSCIIYTFLYGTNVLPSIQPIIWDTFILSENSASYTLAFGFSKIIIALAIYYSQNSYFNFNIASKYNNKEFILGISFLILTIILSIYSGYISYDYKPKLIESTFFLLWSLKMFFLTVIGEELFFRGFIQRELEERIQLKYDLPILISAGLFGIGHIGGGSLYAMLAFIAGLGYGYIYKSTNCVLYPIFIHFLLNTIHLIFFTYPYSLS